LTQQLLNKIQFGTDGWRGIIDEEINFETISLVAQAFADYINSNNSNPKVVIGYDGRKYSKEFAKLFSEVLSGNKIKVYLSKEICPTPFVSYFVKSKKLSAGVMITASHNPANYNGVKFKADYGGPFLTEETHKIEKLIGSSDIKKSEKNVFIEDLSLPYLKQIYRLIDFDTLKTEELNILVDSMAGAGQSIIQNILTHFNIECSTIHFTATNDFDKRSAEPIEQNLTLLSDILLNDNTYSMGLATDGDADRLGVMMEDGKWLSAQETILLLADYVVNVRGAYGKLVKTSSVTSKLQKYLGNGLRAVDDVQVGFKYVCENMLDGETAFGCEESGGYGYGFHIPERDGILSALLMVEMLAKSGFNKLSELVSQKRKQYGQIYYDRIDWHYNNSDRIEKLPNIYNNPPSTICGMNIKSIQEFKSSRNIINGIKFVLGDGDSWLLIRSSETEPLIRIYSEAQDENYVQILLNGGKELINRY
jgi:phosphomannomutase